uniref:Transposase Tc1-like domain-containing protein n=1 Tax=Cyprinus carpio carpio TaxID=630221 RepID=A0A9J8CMQ7_CYPCA
MKCHFYRDYFSFTFIVYYHYYYFFVVAVRRHCITYRNATVMKITTWAQEYFQKTLSVNTFHRAIRRRRLKLYRSKKKPYLNMIQKRKHFLWAKAHLKWTVAKWKTVLWSDESKFEVLFGKLGHHVIRTKEDKDNPSSYQRSVHKPASLMVWGCMSACDMGSLHIWKGVTGRSGRPTTTPNGRVTLAVHSRGSGKEEVNSISPAQLYTHRAQAEKRLIVFHQRSCTLTGLRQRRGYVSHQCGLWTVSVSAELSIDSSTLPHKAEETGKPLCITPLR